MKNYIYKCMTKGTSKEHCVPRHSENWLSARRGSFVIYNDSLECGDWKFPIEDIKKPIIYETKQLGLTVRVLSFDYGDKSYQFGFNPWAKIKKHLPMEYETIKVKMKYSLISVLIRIILVISIILLLF